MKKLFESSAQFPQSTDPQETVRQSGTNSIYLHYHEPKKRCFCHFLWVKKSRIKCRVVATACIMFSWIALCWTWGAFRLHHHLGGIPILNDHLWWSWLRLFEFAEHDQVKRNFLDFSVIIFSWGRVNCDLSIIVLIPNYVIGHTYLIRTLYIAYNQTKSPATLGTSTLAI